MSFTGASTTCGKCLDADDPFHHACYPIFRKWHFKQMVCKAPGALVGLKSAEWKIQYLPWMCWIVEVVQCCEKAQPIKALCDGSNTPHPPACSQIWWCNHAGCLTTHLVPRAAFTCNVWLTCLKKITATLFHSKNEITRRGACLISSNHLTRDWTWNLSRHNYYPAKNRCEECESFSVVLRLLFLDCLK